MILERLTTLSSGKINISLSSKTGLVAFSNGNNIELA